MSEEQSDIERINNAIEILLKDPDYIEGDKKKAFLEIKPNSKIPIIKKYELIYETFEKGLENFRRWYRHRYLKLFFINCKPEKDSVLYNIKKILRKYAWSNFK